MPAQSYRQAAKLKQPDLTRSGCFSLSEQAPTLTRQYYPATVLLITRAEFEQVSASGVRLGLASSISATIER